MLKTAQTSWFVSEPEKNTTLTYLLPQKALVQIWKNTDFISRMFIM